MHFIELKSDRPKRIRKEGIGHKIFSKTNYYNLKGDPFLEMAFGKIESRDYEIIVERLKSRQNIGIDTKHRMIKWIMMLKLRSTSFRENLTRLFTWKEKTQYGLVNGRLAMEEKEAEFILKGRRIAKSSQISAFLDRESYIKSLTAFASNFLNHEWVILSADDSSFITNDNPGFSISISMDIVRLNFSPLSSQFNLDESVYSIHYFPISDKMCLKLIPMIERHAPNTTYAVIEKLMNADIKFEKSTEEEIHVINESTFKTSNEIVVSRHSSQLKKYSDC